MVRFGGWARRLAGGAAICVTGIVGSQIACQPGAAFVCEAADDCFAGASAGFCEASGYCSFPDGTCETGRRYGELAGGGLAGQCVDDDGGTDSVGEGSGMTVGESDATMTSATSEPTTGPSESTTEDTMGPTTSPTSEPTTPTTDPTDTSSGYCGDGVVDVDEECDGEVVAQSCADIGYDGGVLSCSQDCKFDAETCTLCGNGELEGEEQCDGVVPADITCVSAGFTAGGLACTNRCVIDPSGCTTCGDGMREGEEQCDPLANPEVQCGDLGMGDGNVSCLETCLLDASDCGSPMCGAEPPSTIGECPAACSSCADGTCLIDCTGDSTCISDDIVCPPGWPCRVECVGDSACQSAWITCPDFFSCDVTCEGNDACLSSQIDCGAGGSCAVACGGSEVACLSSEINCADDSCSASCDMLAFAAPPDVHCNQSCSCSECG